MSVKNYSLSEVASHASEEDCWIVVHDKVYDVSSFLNSHPGGKNIILKVAGQDASNQFDMFHPLSILKKYEPTLFIGSVRNENESEESNGIGFGDMVPYGDPMWYQDYNIPYYTEIHEKIRAEMRDFIKEHLEPYISEWEAVKKVPKSLRKLFAERGIFATLSTFDLASKYYKGRLVGDLTWDQLDRFVGMIIVEELCKCGSGSMLWFITGGLDIGLPPLIKFGSPDLKERIVPGCLNGEKVICLAITEPAAGSDVAKLQCRAKKTEDGLHYIVNGEKKWITNGTFADYFTVAVRTDFEAKAMKGISLLLIERSMPGVKTRQMNCMGVWASGTAYITFEDVKVPCTNLIGKENEGFKLIMHNFNNERLNICIMATAYARVCYEESIKYAHKRKTFNTLLIDHPVIRDKCANMARKIEATHAWLQSIVYQITKMDTDLQPMRLGGPIALLKAQSTQTFEFCAREASQIFGGLSYTQGGQGAKIERLYREVRAYAIPGGSEEIMLDLGIRQSIKVSKTMNAKF